MYEAREGGGIEPNERVGERLGVHALVGKVKELLRE